MSEKRKLSSESDEEIKKLKVKSGESFLSHFELLPDDILEVICRKLSNEALQNLSTVSKT